MHGLTIFEIKRLLSTFMHLILTIPVFTLNTSTHVFTNSLPSRGSQKEDRLTKNSLPELILDEEGTEGGIISREQHYELLEQREPFDAFLSSKWTGLQSHTTIYRYRATKRLPFVT